MTIAKNKLYSGFNFISRFLHSAKQINLFCTRLTKTFNKISRFLATA